MIKCHFLVSFTSGGFLIPLPGGRDVPGSLNEAHLSVVAVLGEGQGFSEALGGFSGGKMKMAVQLVNHIIALTVLISQ